MKVLIIGSGVAPSLGLIKKELAGSNFIIAADGGGNCLFRYNIVPNFLIGDFDSIKEEALKFFSSKNVSIERHPRNKEATDAKLALNKARYLGAKEIVFLGCTGNRLDHFLGALGLLLDAAQTNLSATIKDDDHTIELLAEATEISGTAGQLFSLQAYGAPVTELHIRNAKFELQNYHLAPGDSLTLSNEFLADKPVHISFTDGKLLLIRNL